jgi:pimeloyl-ACP methyl ester carboxylesterase
LAYAEYGTPDGLPVIYCHGFPGSRLEASLADEPARRIGIRLLAPDRPGFGRSDFLPGRRFSDWPRDVVDLADQLKLNRFDVLGVSGGAPYALACGQALGPRVRHIGLVCGLGELTSSKDTEGMNAAAAAAIRFQIGWPRFGHWTYRHIIGRVLRSHPERIFRILLGHAPPADREVLSDPAVRNRLIRSFAEAFDQGTAGPAHEICLITQPWDIDLNSVRQPVTLWHGEDDRTVPVAMGRRHESHLPHISAYLLENEGHFSIIIRYLKDILSKLIKE